MVIVLVFFAQEFAIEILPLLYVKRPIHILNFLKTKLSRLFKYNVIVHHFH